MPHRDRTSQGFSSAAAALTLLLAACGGGGGGGDPPTPALYADVTATHLPLPVADQQCMDAEALDHDGDGDLDLVLALEFQRNAVLRNDGSAHFTEVGATVGMLAGAEDHEGMTAADLDNDGDLDLAFAGEDTAVHEIYLDQGATYAGLRPASGSTANDVVAFDVDSDGDRDLLFGGDGLLLMLNDGSGAFTAEAPGRFPAVLEVVQFLVVIDIEGDSDLDVVLGTEGQDRLLRNDGTGQFADATAAALPALFDETRVHVFGDYDLDGDQDLFVGNVSQELPGGATLNFLLLNDGTGVFAPAPAGRLPTTFTTYGARALDFDVDGDLDLVLANADLVNGFNLVGFQLLRNDGTGTFTDHTAEAFGGTVPEHGMAVASGDFDGDGLVDLFLCARGTFVAGNPIGFRDRLMLRN